MLFVDYPEHPPHGCAITGLEFDRDRPNRRFLDTQRTLPAHQPRIYVSEAGMEILAREFGYRSEEEYRALEDAYTELQAELERQAMYVAQAEALKHSLDVLESEGFRARKKPGRKPQPKPNEKVAA